MYSLGLCVHTAKSQFHELAGAKEERKEINSDLGFRANRIKYELSSSWNNFEFVGQAKSSPSTTGRPFRAGEHVTAAVLWGVADYSFQSEWITGWDSKQASASAHPLASLWGYTCRKKWGQTACHTNDHESKPRYGAGVASCHRWELPLAFWTASGDSLDSIQS